jgi:hypothetical protein
MDRLEFRTGLNSTAVFASILWVLLGIAAIEWCDVAYRGLLVLLTSPAVLLLMARRGVILDRGRTKVVRWWGLTLPPLFRFPIYWNAQPMERYESVRLTDDERGHTEFIVYLTTVSGALRLGSWETYRQGRLKAEAAGRLLRIPVRDEVSGDHAVRSPDILDEPLIERTSAVTPAAPREARSIRRSSDQELCFEFPPQLHMPLWAVVPPMLLIPSGVAIFFLIDEPMSMESRILTGIGLGAFSAMALTSLVLMIVKPTRCERVVASSDGLRLERRRGSGWVRVGEIPVRELEELEVCAPKSSRPSRRMKGHRVISARSDRRVLEFGWSLDTDELRWIRDELLARLSR